MYGVFSLVPSHARRMLSLKIFISWLAQTLCQVWTITACYKYLAICVSYVYMHAPLCVCVCVCVCACMRACVRVCVCDHNICILTNFMPMYYYYHWTQPQTCSVLPLLMNCSSWREESNYITLVWSEMCCLLLLYYWWCAIIHELPRCCAIWGVLRTSFAGCAWYVIIQSIGVCMCSLQVN